MNVKERHKTKSKSSMREKTSAQASPNQYEPEDLEVQEFVNPNEKNSKKCKANVISRKTTKGKNNELNIKIQSFSVPVGRDISAYDIVTTSPDNRLHVLVKQGRYKKEYESEGKVKTKLLPVAPAGVKGLIKATDLDSGETLELTWQWERLFSFPSIWKKIKSLILKEEN